MKEFNGILNVMQLLLFLLIILAGPQFISNSLDVKENEGSVLCIALMIGVFYTICRIQDTRV